ncbi:uncharacterized protein LOC114942800 [Nylanderia fulva]|uniref:uncharacterized protein LOC114942800 n=1 Tax=Nylanderia fulva TaxID=613905 RepID=UPI0010FB5677|nr:uncharacterized protein LOC114942800 [Nylanderia fulva]
MVFTRKYKPEPIETLKLWGKEIPFTDSVKYLGLILDPKLSWGKHLIEQRKKFYASMWMCRRAMSKSWGISAGAALWLYRAVLLPRLLYASVVWWTRINKGEVEKLLRSLQGNYLRAAVGAMRTTPTEALEIALIVSVTPIGLAAIKSANTTAYRLKCQGEWRNTGLGHTRLGLLQKYPIEGKQDRTTRKYQLVKHFKLWIPDRNEWLKPGGIMDTKVDMWFTDGSGINNCFGAGVYGPGENHRESIPMGGDCTVFMAEMLAILRCAELILTKGTNCRKIYICTDSRAALLALAGATTESYLVWDCMLALEELCGKNKVTLVWVPGHQGIPGNEIADSLAREGASKAPHSREVGVLFTMGKNFIRDSINKQHKARTKELLTLNRQKLRMGIGLLTGHSPILKAHLFNIRLADRKECRLCGEEKEDSIHILCQCPALARKRFRIWGQSFLKS